VKDILVGTVVQQTASQAAGDQTRNGVPIATVPPKSNWSGQTDEFGGMEQPATPTDLNDFYG
jgi:hypothetical protein